MQDELLPATLPLLRINRNYTKDSEYLYEDELYPGTLPLFRSTWNFTRDTEYFDARQEPEIAISFTEEWFDDISSLGGNYRMTDPGGLLPKMTDNAHVPVIRPRERCDGSDKRIGFDRMGTLADRIVEAFRETMCSFFQSRTTNDCTPTKCIVSRLLARFGASRRDAGGP